MKKLEEQFPLYAPNFPVWASQANGMLQISLWSALREKGIAAEAAGRPAASFDSVSQRSARTARRSAKDQIHRSFTFFPVACASASA